MNERAVAADLFRTHPELRLLGARDRASGRLVFPDPGDEALYEPVELPSRGRLWSYTVQRFAPKSPPYRGAQPFAPFAVGYVELPDALIIEAPLVEVRFDALRVGQPMELTTFTLRKDEGEDVLMFAFRPDGDAPRS